MKSFIAKNSDRSDLNSLLPLKMPLGLCVEPTNMCNFKCKQCPVSCRDFGSIVGSRGHMPMSLFEKILRDVKSMGRLKNLNLYGDGEPFLNGNLTEMIKRAVRDNVSDVVAVTTNASLINEDVAAAIVDSGLTYLRVSVYGTDQEAFEQNSGSHVSLHQIRDNLRCLKELRDRQKKQTPFIYVKMLDAYDKEQNLRFETQYRDIADETNIETPMNWNGYEGRDFIHQVDPAGKTDQTTIQGFYLEKGRAGYKTICTTAFHSLNIKQNGDVVVCIVDWNKGTKVGNIDQETLREIWAGARLREFRRMQIDGERRKNVSCRNCNYLYGNPDNIDGLSAERYKEIMGDESGD